MMFTVQLITSPAREWIKTNSFLQRTVHMMRNICNRETCCFVVRNISRDFSSISKNRHCKCPLFWSSLRESGITFVSWRTHLAAIRCNDCLAKTEKNLHDLVFQSTALMSAERTYPSLYVPYRNKTKIAFYSLCKILVLLNFAVKCNIVPQIAEEKHNALMIVCSSEKNVILPINHL